MTSKRKKSDNFGFVVKRLRPYAARYKWSLLIAITLVILSGSMQLVLPAGVKVLFDEMISRNDVRSINMIAGFLVVLFLVRAAISFINQYLIQYIGEKITRDVRSSLMRHYRNIPISYHVNNMTGDFITHLYSDAASVRNILVHYTLTGLSNIIILFGASLVMLSMNAKLGMIVLLLAPSATVVSWIMRLAFQRLGYAVRQALADAIGFAQEYVAGLHVVKIFDTKGFGLKKFEEKLSKHFSLAVKSRRLDAVFNSIIMLMTTLSIIGIFWYGGKEVLSGEITVGALVAFFMYSQNVSQSISALSGIYTSINQAVGTCAKLFRFLDEPIEEQKGAKGVPFQGRNAEIVFQNVSFGYREKPVIRNLSFVLPANHTLAILGRSGIGKSTVLSLVQRFYDPIEGRILVNGIDIRDYDLRSLRENISVVSQDVFLFSDTIKENIRFGNPSATDDEIIQAAKVANAHEFISQLPEGYDTFVGERGAQLSGGQKQRLAIARAVLRGAAILILDEAISSVDDASARLILEALNRLKHRFTMFVVTHRMVPGLEIDYYIDLDGDQVMCPWDGANSREVEKQGLRTVANP